MGCPYKLDRLSPHRGRNRVGAAAFGRRRVREGRCRGNEASRQFQCEEQMNVTRRGRRAVWLAVLLPALLLVAGSPAWAQKTVGEIRGTVTDSTGGVVPGATVLTTNVNTGYTRQVV